MDSTVVDDGRTYAEAQLYDDIGNDLLGKAAGDIHSVTHERVRLSH